MCSESCAHSIRSILTQASSEKAADWPADSQLVFDSEPLGLGLHRVFITVTSEAEDVLSETSIALSEHHKEKLAEGGFPVVEPDEASDNTTSNRWWINLAINSVSVLFLSILPLVFPPSLPLTISLTLLSFLTTAFTGRAYFGAFLKELRHKIWSPMPTAITTGWLLSLAHALYHVITMEVFPNFSMVFMSFIMPVLLMTVVNGMEEMKQWMVNRSLKMQLKGIRALFPEMAEEYISYELSQKAQEEINQCIIDRSVSFAVNSYFNEEEMTNCRKTALRKGMLICVKKGSCFPVDGVIIKGNTLVNAAILTGETQQLKKVFDEVPAGAINLSNDVLMYATQEGYQSRINTILFSANREEAPHQQKSSTFLWAYTGFIVIGVGLALALPAGFGLLTVSLALQNITGILFALCPCTLGIADKLPALLSHYQHSRRGIDIRREDFLEEPHEIETVIFDKTGTLTTGNSQVHSFNGISPELWERIYLLENKFGAEHPIATALVDYHKSRRASLAPPLFSDVDLEDSKSNGLSAKVQGVSVHIGSLAYLQESGVSVSTQENEDNSRLGHTPVYVAESGKYKGVIWVRHESRPSVLSAVADLHASGKQLIMLTGDTEEAALAFNAQNRGFFKSQNIYAGKTPKDKAEFLDTLSPEMLKKTWFIGDGLNDALLARKISEEGGVSCSIECHDKTAFFADISLNGSLDYLLKRDGLNRFLQKTKLQNRGLLVYGMALFLVFIIALSIAGVAVSPLIPMSIMASTTLLTLFNSYRIKMAVDETFDKKTSQFKACFISDLPLSLLVSGSFFLVLGIIITTLATGGLGFPLMAFTAGVATAVSSACVVTSIGLLGSFALLAVGYWLTEVVGIKIDVRWGQSDAFSRQWDDVDIIANLHFENNVNTSGMDFDGISSDERDLLLAEGDSSLSLGMMP